MVCLIRNDPEYEHLTDEQIVGGAFGMVLEKSEAENEKMQNQVSHEAAIVHIDGLAQYLNQQGGASICDKMFYFF